MKPDPEKLHALLDEVLPSSAEHCGPSRADVLHLLRGERQRRRHLLTSVTTLAIVAAALVTLRWKSGPPAAPIIESSAQHASVAIRNVNDEQLFALLRGTPTALMERPNGERTLFIIEH